MGKHLPLYHALLIVLLCSCASSATISNNTASPDSTVEATTIIIPTSAVTPDLAAIAEDYPRVDGSTSTHPLQTTIACTILNIPCRWGSKEEGDLMLLFTNERRVFPDLDAEPPMDLANEVFAIQHSGTHGAYVNLIERKADLILVARAPSEDELALARQALVRLEVLPVALDAFVFLLHQDNPVDDISLDDLRAIYTGAITDWAEVGGVRSELHPYTRNPNSGSQELMESLVMQDTAMIDAPFMMLETMMGPINEIEDDTLGIGYSVYFYASFMYPHEHVKLIAVEGVAPTSENIAAGTYPLVTEVYAVLRAGERRGSTARMLRDWLFTSEGQAAIAESGYVRLPHTLDDCLECIH